MSNVVRRGNFIFPLEKILFGKDRVSVERRDEIEQLFFPFLCFSLSFASLFQLKGVSATLVLEHFSPKKKRLLASLFERFFFSENKHIKFFHLGTLYFSEHCNCSPQKNSPEGKRK